MVKLSFGVRVPGCGTLSGANILVDVSRKAEKFGFDALWMNDGWVMHANPRKRHVEMGSHELVADWPEPTRFETMCSLSYLAGATERIKVGSCILVAPYRNPILVAKQVASLDCLSGGRVILGVGIGNPEAGANAVSSGAPPWEERAVVTDEYIKVMKEVWTKPTSTFNGKYIKFSNLEFYPKPIQKPHPPIWIGGNSRKALKRVAELGNGWSPSALSVGEYKEAQTYLAGRMQKAGRSLDDVVLEWEGFSRIDETREQAISKSRLTMENRYGSAEAGEKRNMIGTARDIIRRIEEYTNLGCRSIQFKILSMSHEDALNQMQTLSTEVIPVFH